MNVYKQLGAFMTNSLIQDSSGCGVSVTDRVVTTNFTRPEYGNVFLRPARANQCTQESAWPPGRVENPPRTAHRPHGSRIGPADGATNRAPRRMTT